ncbi:hypothetical protein [Clostridium akagii]|uniref:hypothetical protein n=1 Tax=Clostridium akagii TaxID=91623 RepID=UPI000689F127|nr:hypothetical protein [Clostridium akagii]
MIYIGTDLLSLINSGNGIIGIDYSEMNRVKSNLESARDRSTDLNRKINTVITKLQVDKGSSRIKMATDQLRDYSRQVTRMQSDIESTINKVDKAIRRFKEVDSACEARIRAVGGNASKKDESFFGELEAKIKGTIKYGEEGLESGYEKAKGEWEEYKKADPIKAGKILGAYDFVKGIITAPINIANVFIKKTKEFESDPVGTIKRWAPYVFKYNTGGFLAVIASYVSSHPEIKEAPKVIMNYMVKEFDEKFIKGDTLTRVRYVTNLKLNILSCLVGGEELAVGSKLGEVSEGTKVGEEINDVSKIDVGASNAEISRPKIDEILSMEKGSRPDPSTYLSKEYIKKHLVQFDDGASIIMTKEQYINYVKGNSYIGIPDDGTQFILSKNVCEEIATKANGNISYYEESLGFDIGHFEDGGGLVQININDVSDLNLRMPSGNEAGANSHWLPGGYTDCGTPEAISNLIPNVDSKVSIIELK